MASDFMTVFGFLNDAAVGVILMTCSAWFVRMTARKEFPRGVFLWTLYWSCLAFGMTGSLALICRFIAHQLGS